MSDLTATSPSPVERHGVVYRLYHGETDYDFPRAWRITRLVSGLALVVSLVALLLGGLNLGIEFEGGTSWEVKAPGVSVEQARDALPSDQRDAKIQVVDGDTLRIQSALDDPAKADQIAQDLGKLGEVTSQQSVGPSWGNEITKKAVRALIVFFVLLALYIWWRLEWKMAAGALLAVLHDIVISVGIYALLRLPVTPATVVSFLTILGYSLYDTVVVFDKVRDLTSRQGNHPRHTYTDTMNLALNQVLMRSINTTLMGVLPVLAMLIVGSFILGGTTLEEFAVALLVGLIVGAYSSIFVAAPIVAWFKEREPRYVAARTRLAAAGESSRSTRAAFSAELEPAGRGARVPGGASATGGGGGGRAASDGSGGGATGTATAAPAAARSAYGNHPPRPRKKKRR